MQDENKVKNGEAVNNEKVDKKEPKKEEAKPVKKSERHDKPKKKKSKGGFFKKISEVFAELKNVTWPKLPNVIKNLGIVLVVTGSFLVVLMGMDYVMRLLYELLVKGLS